MCWPAFVDVTSRAMAATCHEGQAANSSRMARLVSLKIHVDLGDGISTQGRLEFTFSSHAASVEAAMLSKRLMVAPLSRLLIISSRSVQEARMARIVSSDVRSIAFTDPCHWAVDYVHTTTQLTHHIELHGTVFRSLWWRS